MIANIRLVKGETEKAISIYKELLEKTPDNFNTLSQLIELLKKAGRLNETKQYIVSAEKVCKRSSMAGLAFCKGLANYYQNSPEDALKELNFARQDNTFGTLASCLMIEIYLNPT